MHRGRKYIYRRGETVSQLDMDERASKPAVVGRLIDNNHLMSAIPDPDPDDVASVRRLIARRMTDVEDGKVLTEVLGLRWRDIGDWPKDWPIDSR